MMSEQEDEDAMAMPSSVSCKSYYINSSNKRISSQLTEEMSSSLPSHSGKLLHGLIVEDSKIIQKFIKKGLEQKGCIVDVANHGLEAVNMLTVNPTKYDFVTMDLRMPVMDGIQATEKIRNELHLVALPIIVLSAEFSDAVKKQAIQAGGTTFIEKPVNMDDFATLVQQLCLKTNGEYMI